MLIKTKFFLAAAFSLGTACAALAGAWTDPAGYAVPSAAGAKPVHHPRSYPDNARANGSYALAPSVTYKGAASRPRSGCTNVYYYDRALDGYSYDLVCNGIDLSPH